MWTTDHWKTSGRTYKVDHEEQQMEPKMHPILDLSIENVVPAVSAAAKKIEFELVNVATEVVQRAWRSARPATSTRADRLVACVWLYWVQLLKKEHLIQLLMYKAKLFPYIIC